MVTKEEWVIVGLLLGAIAFVGVAVYISKKKSQGLQLKRVSGSRVVLRNLERVEMVRDHEGNLSELVIHREVTQ